MVRGGGLTGLVIATTVDTATLGRAEADTLRAIVDDARLADLPPTTTRPDHPDAQSYKITIEDGGQHHAVILGEPDLSPAARALISWVESAPTREETVT